MFSISRPRFTFVGGQCPAFSDVKAFMRLLIVDDDTALLSVISHSLTKLGHQVSTATDGVAALELLHKEQFPLVITDWGMPKMDGVQLCRAIRTEIKYDVYLILLTG